MKQLPGNPQQPQVSGVIDKVPCPHCGKHNDFRGMEEQQLFDTGHKLLCDHCGGSMEICAIRMVKLVSVRKSAYDGGLSRGRARGADPRQVQRQQLTRARVPQSGLGGMVNRLLGGPKR